MRGDGNDPPPLAFRPFPTLIILAEAASPANLIIETEGRIRYRPLARLQLARALRDNGGVCGS